MRFLRDTTFVTWAALLAVLGGVLLFAATSGPAAEVPRNRDAAHGSVIGAPRSAALTHVESLRGLAPYGIAAGSDAETLAAWAAGIGDAARSGAEARAGEGASAADPLYATLTSLDSAAARLTARSNDVVAARSLRTAILLGIDRALAIADGRPVPPSVEGLAGGEQSPPELVAPLAPPVTAVPSLPTPTPGTGHNHPAPTLRTDPPTPGDLTR